MVYVKNSQAFSLFEILITITILSLLIISSYLLVPKLTVKAQDARRKADLDNIRNNIEIYYSFAGEFPTKLPDCGEAFVYKTQVLLDSMPCDPVTKKPYYYQTKTGQPQSYRLYALLANTNDPSIARAGCLGGCGSDCYYNYGVSSTNIDLVRCSYVCAPGGGHTGYCELYNDPSISLCPKLYGLDSTCKNECNIAKNRCENASGKNIPY